MKSATVTQNQGVFHLSGHINEQTSFQEVIDSKLDPVVLNMEGVMGMSSLGMRKIATLQQACGKRRVEFTDCSRIFVEMINTTRAILGKDDPTERVRSVFAPFKCAACGTTCEVLVKTAEVKATPTGIKLPLKRCQQCRQALAFDGDEDDYFLFMQAP